MRKIGFDAIGAEVSEKQVKYANRFLDGNGLIHTDPDSTVNIIKNTDREITSFIGVLEHLTNLDKVLEALNGNNNIKYIYFSVPMFSYSAVIESIHPTVFNRLLGGTHTHLFTEKSLSWLMKEYSWDLEGAWYFGTDIADVIRTVIVENEKKGNNDLNEIFFDKSREILDGLQKTIDKQKFCSEVHMVVKKS